ncbi:MAG: mechanosensitive ion channel domain-containing protein [Acidobacteriota bacterium]|nr:mechanosensitive ion channel domain-containing protein [Acidobacteriota bacterium]
MSSSSALVAGIATTVERPFRINDWIRVHHSVPDPNHRGRATGSHGQRDEVRVPMSTAFLWVAEGPDQGALVALEETTVVGLSPTW